MPRPSSLPIRSSNILNDPEVKKQFAEFHVEWTFNLEKASWWGGGACLSA